MSGDHRAPFALVTSGLGSTFGGIGVVSESVFQALAFHGPVDVWRHPPYAPGLLRRAALLARSVVGAARRPRAVIYTHVDLARLHVLNPLLRSIPSVVFLHGTEVWGPLDGLRRRALERATLRIAVSHYTEARARQSNPWLPPAIVTWLGVPSRPMPPVGERKPHAVIVSRLDPSERQKGHDPILDAWPAVVRAVPGAELSIVGDGQDRARLEERVRQEKLQGVRFTGRVDEAQRTALYQVARVFLFPSLQEGFGLAAVEAAQMGTPVLAVGGSVLEEILPESFLVTAPTREHLEPAIIGALKDPAEARRRGLLSQARVTRSYLEPHFIRRWEQALAPLLGTN